MHNYKLSRVPIETLTHDSPIRLWDETYTKNGLFIRIGGVVLLAPKVHIKPFGDEIQHLDIYRQAKKWDFYEARKLAAQKPVTGTLPGAPVGVEDAGHYTADFDIERGVHDRVSISEFAITTNGIHYGRPDAAARQTTVDIAQELLGSDVVTTPRNGLLARVLSM